MKIFATVLVFLAFFSCSDDGSEDIDGGEDDFRIINAFPDLSFDQPVFLTHAGDGTDQLFVAERQGTIMMFANSSLTKESRQFLDLRDRVNSGGGEQGLLGLAFHNSYPENGRLYVNYTGHEGQTVIAEFTADIAANKVNEGTERILLEIDQPFVNHNAGMLAFGNDGFLYIATGDGGSRGDPQNNAQNLGNLLGKILRIDVDDNPVNNVYGIPEDNPFVDKGIDIREEIFAYGLRNPWRFSFDSETGELWAADVGQNRIEEVNIIVPGGNYGWRIMEGSECFESESCDQTNLILPVAEYNHDNGVSITGGYVYRGSLLPEVRGFYFYADFSSGTVWGLNTADIGQGPRELLSTGINVSSFGVDANEELYLLDFQSGSIFTFTGRL